MSTARTVAIVGTLAALVGVGVVIARRKAAPAKPAGKPVALTHVTAAQLHGLGCAMDGSVGCDERGQALNGLGCSGMSGVAYALGDLESDDGSGDPRTPGAGGLGRFHIGNPFKKAAQIVQRDMRATLKPLGKAVKKAVTLQVGLLKKQAKFVEKPFTAQANALKKLGGMFHHGGGGDGDQSAADAAAAAANGVICYDTAGNPISDPVACAAIQAAANSAAEQANIYGGQTDTGPGAAVPVDQLQTDDPNAAADSFAADSADQIAANTTGIGPPSADDIVNQYQQEGSSQEGTDMLTDGTGFPSATAPGGTLMSDGSTMMPDGSTVQAPTGDFAMMTRNAVPVDQLQPATIDTGGMVSSEASTPWGTPAQTFIAAGAPAYAWAAQGSQYPDFSTAATGADELESPDLNPADAVGNNYLSWGGDPTLPGSSGSALTPVGMSGLGDLGVLTDRRTGYPMFRVRIRPGKKPTHQRLLANRRGDVFTFEGASLLGLGCLSDVVGLTRAGDSAVRKRRGNAYAKQRYGVTSGRRKFTTLREETVRNRLGLAGYGDMDADGLGMSFLSKAFKGFVATDKKIHDVFDPVAWTYKYVKKDHRTLYNHLMFAQHKAAPYEAIVGGTALSVVSLGTASAAGAVAIAAGVAELAAQGYTDKRRHDASNSSPLSTDYDPAAQQRDADARQAQQDAQASAIASANNSTDGTSADNSGTIYAQPDDSLLTIGEMMS